MLKDCTNDHVGAEPIKVGPYQVYATGMNYINRGLVDLSQFDVLVPLDHKFREDGTGTVIPLIIADFQPPGPEAVGILKDQVIPALKAGKKVLFFCTASHGRTGTIIAGLIALLEPETDDPIAAVRERHCENSVETAEQARWVRNLHDQALALKVDEVVAEADPC
jgi:protein-tyrosine phosphatase